MRALASYVSFISAINTLIGRVFSWLALAVVLVCFTVVVQRYLFSTTQIWMQDLYVWLSGIMFMAISGYALMRDQHVRVDIFYQKVSVRAKAWLDLLGVTICLIPFCTVVWIYAWPYVRRAWRLYEASPNVGGMPGFFILKSFILVFVVMTLLQGLAMAARAILVIANRESLLPQHLQYKREGN